MTYQSEYLTILHERGFIQALTDAPGLDQKMATESVAAYIGFDCTAPSLHVGSLVQIMMLAWLQRTGHKPLVLMGGGTTKVGDPSGKDESRQLLQDQDIAHNMHHIQQIFQNFMTFGSGPNDAELVNNDAWLDNLNYIHFLRDYGKHFSVNKMMSFDSVKLRLDREQNLSFLEFNYMILQSYDFVELNKRYNCILQMGGSDQWGNIVSGIDLGRRILKTSLYGLTTPLLTTSSGAKMGKTASGAVWLNADKLSDWEYWQYWRNVSDADVGRFLKLFTFMPLDEIEKISSLQGAELNEAKKILATEVTALARGRIAAEAAQKSAIENFEKGNAAALPELTVSESISLIDFIYEQGLLPSKSEVRRMIKGGGIKIDDVSIQDMAYMTPTGCASFKLSLGKKKHFLVTYE